MDGPVGQEIWQNMAPGNNVQHSRRLLEVVGGICAGDQSSVLATNKSGVGGVGSRGCLFRMVG